MAINVNEINAALEQIEINKGISRERVLEALKESMTKAYKKSLGGDDALVGVTIDLDTGVIEMYQIKNVVAVFCSTLDNASLLRSTNTSHSRKHSHYHS